MKHPMFFLNMTIQNAGFSMVMLVKTGVYQVIGQQHCLDVKNLVNNGVNYQPQLVNLAGGAIMQMIYLFR